MIDRFAVEQFLYREARLMDEMDYAEWLALWDRDGVYHVPITDGRPGAARQVSIIRDDYVRLEQRVDRLKSGSVLAVEGQQGAMRRILSNIEASDTEDADGLIEVRSNFLLGVARTEAQQFWMGATTHRLRPGPNGLRIARKTVRLINSARELPLLQFLI